VRAFLDPERSTNAWTSLAAASQLWPETSGRRRSRFARFAGTTVAASETPPLVLSERLRERVSVLASVRQGAPQRLRWLPEMIEDRFGNAPCRIFSGEVPRST
jgi:hypothetical protein